VSATINYLNLADKAQKWPNATLPEIILSARDAVAGGQANPALFSWLSRMGLVPQKRVLPLQTMTLAKLHNAARAGRYVEEIGPRDEVQAVEKTLSHGGDCEDWAAVLVAVALLWGANVRIVTSGAEIDNFYHVYAEIQDSGGVWHTLDPKGCPEGAAFDFRSEQYPVRRWWIWRGNNSELIVDEVRP
jgi:hypothetical protein